jgi:hypothetical protein
MCLRASWGVVVPIVQVPLGQYMPRDIGMTGAREQEFAGHSL